jgi:tyrosinase
LSFITALKCLQAKPAKTAKTCAGTKSRYIDYQALHIQQTDFIHFDGVFLPWHRYLLYLFEQDLRSTCGHTGTIP